MDKKTYAFQSVISLKIIISRSTLKNWIQNLKKALKGPNNLYRGFIVKISVFIKVDNEIQLKES